MNQEIDLTKFEKLDPPDLASHIFELYTVHKPPEHTHLGYISRTSNSLSVSIGKDVEFEIEQSLTELSSGRESSSTGFVCWQTTPLIAEWLLFHENCPFRKIFQYHNNLVIVELGAGVSGIIALSLSPKSGHYIATDQEHLLKLLKSNISNNISGVSSETIECLKNVKKGSNSKGYRNLYSPQPIQNPKIDVVEYDWEQLEYGFANIQKLINLKYSKGDEPVFPDFIIACDTIYNEYLVPYFVEALVKLMGASTGALVNLQLRDESVLEYFLEYCFDKNCDVYLIPFEYALPEMREGFVAYYITKGSNSYAT